MIQQLLHLIADAFTGCGRCGRHALSPAAASAGRMSTASAQDARRHACAQLHTQTPSERYCPLEQVFIRVMCVQLGSVISQQCNPAATANTSHSSPSVSTGPVLCWDERGRAGVGLKQNSRRCDLSSPSRRPPQGEARSPMNSPGLARRFWS